jgi:hypothetical protein
LLEAITDLNYAGSAEREELARHALGFQRVAETSRSWRASMTVMENYGG